MSKRYNRSSNDNDDDPQDERFRKLFIGGMSYGTTKQTMKEHFEKYGEIVDCVVMKNRATKKSRGFGFVTYKTAEMLDEAQKNRPHTVDGRELDTKRATPRSESSEGQSNASQSSVKKMFVGGLKDATEDEIREVFGRFGKIEDLAMIKDRNTGKQKGFCFVTFDDYDSVDKCVLMRRISLNGKYVEVKKAVPKDQDGSMGGGRGDRDGSRGGMGSGGGFGGYNNGPGYGSGGPQGYGGGNPGGYGAGGGPQRYGGGDYRGFGSGYTNSNGMGGRYGGSGGDFHNGYNFGSGYGSGQRSGPTRGDGFAKGRAGPYGNGYGSSRNGGYRR